MALNAARRPGGMRLLGGGGLYYSRFQTHRYDGGLAPCDGRCLLDTADMQGGRARSGVFFQEWGIAAAS